MTAIVFVLVAGGFLDVLGSIVGVLLALAGLAIAFMGLFAITDGAAKRGAGGVVVGLGLAAAGCLALGVL